MKLHLSVPGSLILLGLILVIGCATGALWPVHSFLLDFSTGFTEALLAIFFIASLVWGACAFSALLVRRVHASGRRH
jgi:hypothetical protein